MTTQAHTQTPLERLRHHVSGAIARGESAPIVEVAGPAKHTPGPWTADRDGVILGTLGPARPFVGRIDDDYNDGQTAANRHLIAAAPDLLEALRGFHPSQIKTQGELARAWEVARAAIAKAEGAQ